MRLITLINILMSVFTGVGQSFTFTQLAEYEMSSIWPTVTLAPRLDNLGRDYLYTANNEQGIRVFDISTVSTPVLVHDFPNTTFGGWKAMNLEQDGNFLYASIGGIFSGAGVASTQATGLAIFDVTSPSTMFMTSYWDSVDIFQGTAVTKVVGNYAFLGGMEEGLVILDVSDPYDIRFVSHYVPDINFPSVPAPTSTVPNARGMWVEGDLVYLAYDRGAFRIIDVSDVFNPVQLSQFVNPSLDAVAAKAYNNVEVRGTHAFIPVDYCGLDVVDISDPNAPISAGWFDPWGCTFFNWLGGEGHSNELEFVNDSILFMTGGHHDLMAINVSDPTNPVLVGEFGDPLDSLVVWGLDVQGGRVALGYIDNISAIPYDSKWGGFKILDWSMAVDLVSNETNAVRIFPNPSSGIFNFNGNVKNCTYKLYSITGGVIDAGSMRSSFDLSLFPEGVYALVVKQGEFIKVMKLILENED